MKKMTIFSAVLVILSLIISCAGGKTEMTESEKESSAYSETSADSDVVSETISSETESYYSDSESISEDLTESASESESSTSMVPEVTPVATPVPTVTSRPQPTATPKPPKQPARLDITQGGNYVSILYLTWFNDHVEPEKPIYDISKILRANPVNPQWGPELAKHFWTEPALGYYRSDDVQIMKTHMRQIYEMGVDFLVLDTTNNRQSWPVSYSKLLAWDPIDLLLKTMLEMRENGEKTPYVSFWAGTWTDDVADTAAVPRYIYNRYYKSGKYDELFVYYQGKPLISVTDDNPEELKEYFTVRKKWGMRHSLPEGEWSGLEKYPQRPGVSNGITEHLVVSAATQLNHMNIIEPVGNYQPPLTRNGGRYYAKQWSRAFELKPKIVFLTEWNSWSAIRFVETIDGKEYTFFTDSYDMERSRCLEPMKYGYKDLYYRWTKEYIKAYKANQQMPQGLHIAQEEHVMTWN